MTVTIHHDNGNTYTWSTGDDPIDLRCAISSLTLALDEAASALGIATSPQLPIDNGTVHSGGVPPQAKGVRLPD